MLDVSDAQAILDLVPHRRWFPVGIVAMDLDRGVLIPDRWSIVAKILHHFQAPIIGAPRICGLPQLALSDNDMSCRIGPGLRVLPHVAIAIPAPGVTTQVSGRTNYGVPEGRKYKASERSKDHFTRL